MKTELSVSVNTGRCRLCLEDAVLCGSHVIPNAFFKMAKKRSSQLVVMTVPSNDRPRLENVNWVESLLCAKCEAFLRDSYETSQIEKLKGFRDKVTTSEEKVTLYSLDYQKFYLFWVSILWRASVSSLSVFKSVNFPDGLNDLMRSAILARRIKYEHYDLSDLIQIAMIKIKPHGYLKGDDLRAVMSSFKAFLNGVYPCYFFMSGGFGILYQIADESRAALPQGFKAIKNSRVYRIPKYAPLECEVLRQSFADTADVALQYPDFIGSKIKGK